MKNTIVSILLVCFFGFTGCITTSTNSNTAKSKTKKRYSFEFIPHNKEVEAAYEKTDNNGGRRPSTAVVLAGRTKQQFVDAIFVQDQKGNNMYTLVNSDSSFLSKLVGQSGQFAIGAGIAATTFRKSSSYRGGTNNLRTDADASIGDVSGTGIATNNPPLAP